MCADSEAGRPLLTLVLCESGGVRFGFEARHLVARLGAVAAPEVAALDALLGLPRSADALPRELLQLRTGHLVSVAGTPTLIACAADAIHPLPTLVAARNRLVGLAAFLTTAEGEALPLFDLALLGPVAQGSQGRAVPQGDEC